MHFFKPKRRIHRPKEQGAALVVVLALLLVLTLIGLGSITTATREYSITANRTFGLQALQVSKGALHMAINHFRRNPSILRVLQNKAGVTNGPLCGQPRTLCFTAASFFPGTTELMQHRAFAQSGFFVRRSGERQRIYADFRVVVRNPVKSIYDRPMAGFSINTGKMCTYTVTFTSTGFVRDPTSNVKSFRFNLAQKTQKARVQIMAAGDLCN